MEFESVLEESSVLGENSHTECKADRELEAPMNEEASCHTDLR